MPGSDAEEPRGRRLTARDSGENDAVSGCTGFRSCARHAGSLRDRKPMSDTVHVAMLGLAALVALVNVLLLALSATVHAEILVGCTVASAIGVGLNLVLIAQKRAKPKHVLFRDVFDESGASAQLWTYMTSMAFQAVVYPPCIVWAWLQWRGVQAAALARGESELLWAYRPGGLFAKDGEEDPLAIRLFLYAFCGYLIVRRPRTPRALCLRRANCSHERAGATAEGHDDAAAGAGVPPYDAAAPLHVRRAAPPRPPRAPSLNVFSLPQVHHGGPDRAERAGVRRGCRPRHLLLRDRQLLLCDPLPAPLVPPRARLTLDAVAGQTMAGSSTVRCGKCPRCHAGRGATHASSPCYTSPCSASPTWWAAGCCTWPSGRTGALGTSCSPCAPPSSLRPEALFA